jgi:hypothetical protein
MMPLHKTGLQGVKHAGPTWRRNRIGAAARASGQGGMLKTMNHDVFS